MSKRQYRVNRWLRRVASLTPRRWVDYGRTVEWGNVCCLKVAERQNYVKVKHPRLGYYWLHVKDRRKRASVVMLDPIQSMKLPVRDCTPMIVVRGGGWV